MSQEGGMASKLGLLDEGTVTSNACNYNHYQLLSDSANTSKNIVSVCLSLRPRDLP